MNKGLEAFYKLFQKGKTTYTPINFIYKPRGLRDDLCNQVEQALERLEELEEVVEFTKRYFELDEKLHTDRLTIVESQERTEISLLICNFLWVEEKRGKEK